MIFPRITARNIFNQIKADAIGKDSHRGVTLTYSWLANQVGHFSLGFIPTILLIPCVIKYGSFDDNALVSAICVSINWLLFELYNFLGPLLAGRNSKAKFVYVPEENKTVFRPAWGNIAFDTFTDLLFFWIGAFTAAIFMNNENKFTLIFLIVLIALVALPARYWFLTKMYLQNTYYPFQFRLSQWTFPISQKDKDAVLRFMNLEEEANHLIVFGSKNKGKTSLSVGIATELSIKHRPCLYTTASKIYSDFSDETEAKIRMDDLWSWRNCSVLIIDDINPGPPIDDLITADKFRELVDVKSGNREILSSKKVIWVLGEAKKMEKAKENWKSLLMEIGIPEEKIESVEL
jgi:hypothetical protein